MVYKFEQTGGEKDDCGVLYLLTCKAFELHFDKELLFEISI